MCYVFYAFLFYIYCRLYVSFLYICISQLEPIRCACRQWESTVSVGINKEV